MSLLDRYKQSTLGTTPPQVTYTKKVQGRNLTPTADLATAASNGYAFRDATLGTTKYTDEMPEVSTTSLYDRNNLDDYRKSTFNDLLAGKNRLADNNAKTYAFRDPSLGTARYIDNVPTDIQSSKLGTISGNYQTSTFQDKLKGANKLTDYKAKTYAFRPGNFKTDIATYTERLFLQQQQAAGQTPTGPSNLITATAQTVPVLTPTTLVGTTSGMPFDDGRYDITIGFGFIQYGVGNYV